MLAELALPAVAQDWILTYLLHSTILLGGLWILSRAVRKLPAAWQESLWRTALLGGLVVRVVPTASPPSLKLLS